MKTLTTPQFKSYEEETAFWDNLDTADFMEDDGEWFHFQTTPQQAVRIAILPQIAEELMRQAQTQGVSAETLANVFLAERLRQAASAA